MDNFHVDAGLMLWTLITFGVLLVLLVRFAFNPLRKLLAEREAFINDSLAKAGRAREDAEKLLEDNRRKLDDAHRETGRIIDEGHRVVADMKREAERKAREEADRIVAMAREEIDREMVKNLEQLKATVASLSVRISRQVIGDEVDQAMHEKLTDNFIERLKKGHVRATDGR